LAKSHAHKKGLIGDVKVKSSFGCPDHEMESRIPRGGWQVKKQDHNPGLEETRL